MKITYSSAVHQVLSHQFFYYLQYGVTCK